MSPPTRMTAVATLALVLAACGGTTHATAPARASAAAPPYLVARLTGEIVHKAAPWGPAKATISFTVGEGGSPGTGIPHGSVISVLVFDKKGRPGTFMIRAYGARGHYNAVVSVPSGGVGHIEVGGFLNLVGHDAADGDWVIPFTPPSDAY